MTVKLVLNPTVMKTVVGLVVWFHFMRPLINHMKRGTATSLCKDEMQIMRLSPWSGTYFGVQIHEIMIHQSVSLNIHNLYN